MIRQASAWGQFWRDLSDRHDVHGCGIYTPLWHEPRPLHRGRYYSTWFRMVPYAGGRSPIYYSVNGDTMWEMMRDGLNQTGTNNLQMKLALLNCVIEHITDWQLKDYR
jgi:hypothetical protein